MLAALDLQKQRAVYLPDFAASELESLRARTSRGELGCPECKARLILRAGDLRIHHFAHRERADCPHGNESAERLLARLLLYRFFKEREDSKKLADPVELEPPTTGLPSPLRVDLIVHRGPNYPPVAVMLIGGRIAPESRAIVESWMHGRGLIFRPIFLMSGHQRVEGEDNLYRLDTTQRDWLYTSRYGDQEIAWGDAKTLHFLDQSTAEWLTLRGLYLRHRPGAFGATSIRRSPMQKLLWSEAEVDWVHEGEIRARPPTPSMTSPPLPTQRRSTQREKAAAALAARPAHKRILPLPAATPHPAPQVWPDEVFRCIGCQRETDRWINAKTADKTCVCNDCFERGVRLP